jgi:hypothetical protein
MSLIYEFTIGPNGIDDTSNIQNAIDILRGTEDGTLFIFQYHSAPYLVSNIGIPANFTLIGNGVTIKQLNNTDNLPIFILEQAWDTRIEGFNFDGNMSGIKKVPKQYNSNAILIIDCENIELYNLTFKDVLLSCIAISKNVEEGCYNIKINNCISKDMGMHYENEDYWGAFVYVNDSYNISIRNSTVTNCYGNGILMESGNNISIDNLVMENVDKIDGISAVNCSGLRIQNCLFKDIASCPIEFNGVSEFNIVNNVVEYSEGYNVNLVTNHGIMISYNGDPQTLPNIISLNGLIQNFQGSTIKPSEHYTDINISGSENITLTSCNCPQSISLSRWGNMDFSVACSNISIIGSSASELYIFSLTNVKIDGSNFGALRIAHYIHGINPINIWLRNSTFLDITLFNCQDVQIENCSFNNIINTDSTFYCLNNQNGLDLYYEGFPDEGNLIFTLPFNTYSNGPGLFFGTMAIDVVKTTDQYDSFISDLYYIRSQPNGTRWLIASPVLSSISSSTTVPTYSFYILNEQIHIGAISGFMVRLTFKLGIDTV